MDSSITDHDVTYLNRIFLPLHGVLMEVTPDEYEQFYKESRRQKYQRELSKSNGDISLDSLSGESISDLINGAGTDVSELVEERIMKEKLSEAIAMLPKNDQLLIYHYYYSGISEIRLAELYGVTQQTISYRIKKVQTELKKILC